MAEVFAYGGQTILSHPIFVETILPAVLIFTIVFAILQKSKVLGDDKKQVDAIVSLAVALLVISFAQAVGIILQLIPFLAVSLVVLIILFVLLGSFLKDEFSKPISSVLVYVIVVAVAIAVMYITGAWQYLVDLIYGGTLGDSEIFMNVLFIIIIIAAVAAVLRSGGKAKS